MASRRTEDGGEGVVSAGRRVVDRGRPELNRPADERRSAGASGGDAVRLAVRDGARDGRPAERVEARVMEAEHVALANADELVAVERDVDVTQRGRTGTDSDGGDPVHRAAASVQPRPGEGQRHRGRKPAVDRTAASVQMRVSGTGTVDRPPTGQRHWSTHDRVRGGRRPAVHAEAASVQVRVSGTGTVDRVSTQVDRDVDVTQLGGTDEGLRYERVRRRRVRRRAARRTPHLPS